MTLRTDLLELTSAVFHTDRQPSPTEFFAGKEESFSEYGEKRLKFNFI
jgi:hypothetical protein